jgi:hypothetical protein
MAFEPKIDNKSFATAYTWNGAADHYPVFA